MTDLLQDIIGKIDAELVKRFTGKYYGIAEIVNGQGERYPVTINAKRDRVSPMDTWQLQTYHKLGNITELPDTETFGRDRMYSQTVSMVVITNVNIGEYIIHKIARRLPAIVKGVGGFAILGDDYAIINDHEQLISSDFGAMTKERLVKNIWQINYTLNVTVCK